MSAPSVFTPPHSLRDLYRVETESAPNTPGTWSSTLVKVFRADVQLAEFTRDYSFLSTFHPFSQWDGSAWRDFALVSPEYTRTSVLDLSSGEIVAEEEESFYDAERTRPGAGFCPVEFYVPSWHDVHDGSILPGSPHWREDMTLPAGLFGLVAGCHWGDDSSWKIQHLDLSRVQEGILTRDDRFGYVELPPHLSLKDAVEYYPPSSFSLAVSIPFDLTSGAPSSYALEGLTSPQYRSFSRPTDSSADSHAGRGSR